MHAYHLTTLILQDYSENLPYLPSKRAVRMSSSSQRFSTITNTVQCVLLQTHLLQLNTHTHTHRARGPVECCGRPAGDSSKLRTDGGACRKTANKRLSLLLQIMKECRSSYFTKDPHNTRPITHRNSPEFRRSHRTQTELQKHKHTSYSQRNQHNISLKKQKYKHLYAFYSPAGVTLHTTHPECVEIDFISSAS